MMSGGGTWRGEMGRGGGGAQDISLTGRWQWREMSCLIYGKGTGPALFV